MGRPAVAAFYSYHRLLPTLRLVTPLMAAPPSSRGRHGRTVGTLNGGDGAGGSADGGSPPDSPPPSPPRPMEIKVRVFPNAFGQGKLLRLQADGNDTIGSVKGQIEGELEAMRGVDALPSALQRLIFLGEELRDSRTLADYQVSQERVLTEETLAAAATAAAVAQKEAQGGDEETKGDAEGGGEGEEAADPEAEEAERLAADAKQLASSNAEIPLILHRKLEDKDEALEAVGLDGGALQRTAPELQVDKEIALAAVTQCGLALEHAGGFPVLRGDPEVVLAAVSQNGLALRFASDELRADAEVVTAAVEQDGRALEFAAKPLHDDDEVVIGAVRQNGYALQWATPRLRADKEVVTEAVRQRGAALGYASTALRMRPDSQALAAESGWR